MKKKPRIKKHSSRRGGNAPEGKSAAAAGESAPSATGRSSSAAKKSSSSAAGESAPPAAGEFPPSACLTVVATPIGNLSDFSPRGREALKSADVLAAEDTRRARRLLAGCGLATPPVLFSYRAENETAAARRVTAHLAAGRRVALISDAGMPLVSDPGAAAVAEAARRGVRVEVLPGPSAVTAAVALSGFGGKGFVFLGFLPLRAARIRRTFAGAAEFSGPLVMFENPRRLARSLRLGAEVLGERRGVICFEMSKRFEREWRGVLGALAERAEGCEGDLPGEAMLAIAGAADSEE